ncbi:MAG: alpha/beta hydrolase [Thermomicrobiales bacterium]
MANETTTQSAYLDVPGARLYYETMGTGPVLLVIPGGAADASGFVPMGERLADRFTVVRYDPRGVSRSAVPGLAEDVPVETHADDARRLLQAVTDEPATVFGHSGGAVISLALVELAPDLVATLVAHEPPVATLLPDGDPRRDVAAEIVAIYGEHGVGPAMGRFLEAAGMDGPPPAMAPEVEAFMMEQFARMEANTEFFLAHYLLPITSYQPDIARLQGAPTRVLIGVGEESVGQETYDTSLALAAALGSDPVFFPGDHIGMSVQPDAFTARLREVLGVG